MLLDLATIPCPSSSANSFLATSSFSGSSLRYLEVTGREHVVSITCSTLCRTGGSFLDAISTRGNSAATEVWVKGGVEMTAAGGRAHRLAACGCWATPAAPATPSLSAGVTQPNGSGVASL